jgi:actin-like ATPase involved in cell morphogenesis
MLEKEMKKRFNENKKRLIGRAKEELESAEEMQVVITENGMLVNGGGASILAGVCCLIEKLNKEGIPSRIIEEAVHEAISGKDETEQLKDLFKELLDRL